MDEKIYNEMLEILINASTPERLKKTCKIIEKAIEFQEKLKRPLTKFEIQLRHIEQSM